MSAAVSAKPLWQLAGVQMRQDAGYWPAEPITVSVPAGRVAVLGDSGAGKSSLLNLLVGFVAPARGTVSGPAEIAWVPQSHGLWGAHTAREHLTLVAANSDRAETLLKQFDLSDVASQKARTLSIGEGARLAVARALAQNASTFVMDEPLAHVDSGRMAKYWQAIRERISQPGTALVFATHQPELALAEAEWAICLRNGAVIFQGPVPTLYHEPATQMIAEFLGPCNWITPEAAERWLGEETSAARCIRPERLQMTESPDGFAVCSSRFMGSHAETEVRHPSGETRAFLHRPVSALPIGTRVSIQEASRA
jgi:iron(III) transport system ATP-binding protein